MRVSCSLAKDILFDAADQLERLAWALDEIFEAGDIEGYGDGDEAAGEMEWHVEAGSNGTRRLGRMIPRPMGTLAASVSGATAL
jgi:hypothetical protein